MGFMLSGSEIYPAGRRVSGLGLRISVNGSGEHPSTWISGPCVSGCWFTGLLCNAAWGALLSEKIVPHGPFYSQLTVSSRGVQRMRG